MQPEKSFYPSVSAGGGMKSFAQSEFGLRLSERLREDAQCL